MSYKDEIDCFFEEKIYDNLAEFAIFPVSWALKNPDSSTLFLAAFLAPVLVPATLTTSVIAVCLAGIATLFHHLFSLLAKITDRPEHPPVPRPVQSTNTSI